MSKSAIYAGEVVHVRRRPRRHRLRYRVFSLLLDLDALPQLDRSLRLFAHNRPAIFSFHDKDHGDGTKGGLRAWIEAQLSDAGLTLDHPQISVLCYPRIFGYVFNPLTVYYCSGATGALRAVLYEVCNTYGERHTYIIPVTGPTGTGLLRQRAPKRHFVSPFMPMDCTYDFAMRPPAGRILVRIDESDPAGPLLLASFTGRRRDLTDAALLQMLLTYPLMTLKVTAAIHWEALKLLAKGLKLQPHTSGPKVARTIVPVAPPSSGPRPPSPIEGEGDGAAGSVSELV